jgi:hypothetical protein
MYCPKCGDLMEETDASDFRELYGPTCRIMYRCARGDMYLSPKMATDLYDSFVAKTAPPAKPAPQSFRWGSGWHCPLCGVPMEELKGTNAVLCPICGGNLGPFIYHLVELHPHRSDNGGWR